MPFEVSYNPSTDAFIDVRLSGQVSHDEWKQTLGASATAYDHGATRALLDFAGIRNREEVFRDFLSSVARSTLPREVRRAMVTGPMGVGALRAWALSLDAARMPVRTFADRESAIAWLLDPDAD